MLVFNERRAESVLKYSDLTKRYAEYVETQHKYWDRMRLTAMQLLKDLESSLELPHDSWKDHTGRISRYVDIGSSKDGEFKRVHPIEFQEADYNYRFQIRITLEEGPEVLPKASFIQTVTLRGSESNVVVRIHDSDNEATMRVPREIESGQFSQVVEVIKSRLMDQLSTRDIS